MIKKNLTYIFIALLYVFKVNATFTLNQDLDTIKSPINSMSMGDTIPNEVLVNIFDYLDGKDFQTLKKVCRKFNILASDPSLIIPTDDKAYFELIENKPQLALKRMSRISPKILLERNKSLANNLMIGKLPEDNPEFLKRWRNYVFLALFNHQFKSNDLYDELQEILNIATERFENFDIVFSNLSCADQFSRRNAIWEQLAYVDDIKRKELIELYLNGSDQHLPKNETRAHFLKKYGEILQSLLLQIPLLKAH